MDEIYEGIEIRGKTLFIKKHNALVLSDLQIGYEDKMLREGMLIPKFQFRDIKKDMEKILHGKMFEKIIINGDFKHVFGKITEQEWREAMRFIDLLLSHCSEIILVKGNHDIFLGPIARKRNIKIFDDFFLDDIFMLHGDKMKKIPTGVKTLIIGHEHPAIGLQRDIRVEKYKCFLKGKYKKHDLIVLPSFNPLVAGTDILREKIMSPFIKNIESFEVYVIEDKPYYFGKIRDL